MKKLFALAAALAFIGGLGVAQADDGAVPAEDEAAPVVCAEDDAECAADVASDDNDDIVE